MRRKFTILLFSLLLAVGWTSTASAQALPMDIKSKAPARETKQSDRNEVIGQSDFTWQPISFKQGSQFRAPLRSQNYSLAATVTHPKSWYQALPAVTWNGGSQNITEPFTDVDGMMALVKRVYTDKDIPGAKYSETWHCDIPYQTIEHGWNIVGNEYEDVQVLLYSGYIDVLAIRVKDKAGNVLDSWVAPQTSGASAGLPSGWSADATLTQERVYSSNMGGYVYAYYMASGGIITIPASSLANNNNTGYASIEVCTKYTGSSPTTSSTTVYVGNETYSYVRDSSYTSDFYFSLPTYIPGTIQEPDECGYTVLLVKLYDGKNQSGSYEAPDYTYSESELRDYFSEYIKEIDLLTDGMRVNEGEDDAGTLFAYTGDLGRFYLIGKGKMAYTSSLEIYPFDRAPFYSMYEEFSPTVEGGSEDHTDFYEKMKQGVTYPVVHDCMSVNYLQHYFSMAGKAGTTENHVNSLVFYIPDNRGNGDRWSRSYDTDHQPTVGMYMIDLYADIEPSTTPDMYTVTVDWTSNLDDITHSEGIDQTYKLYEIYDKDGDGDLDTTCVYTGPLTTWSFDYPVGDPSAYDISYYVIGTPTAATNQDTFFAKSNTDDVTVPGKTDFIGLQWWRYESDYVTDDGTNQEVNYYRNFLAPHALAVQGQAGINAGNVGTTGRKLTLYRDETPIIDLDLVMDGNKAYYRIKYINRNANQQVEPGYDPNTGERISTNN